MNPQRQVIHLVVIGQTNRGSYHEEETFDIEIPDEDAEKVVTIGDVVKYISEKIN